MERLEELSKKGDIGIVEKLDPQPVLLRTSDTGHSANAGSCESVGSDYGGGCDRSGYECEGSGAICNGLAAPYECE